MFLYIRKVLMEHSNAICKDLTARANIYWTPVASIGPGSTIFDQIKALPGVLWHSVGYWPVFPGHCEIYFQKILCFRAIVMFLVEERQTNIFDQRCIENELWKR